MFKLMSDEPDLKQFLATKEPADLGPGPRPGVLSRTLLESQIKAVLDRSNLSHERRELIRALLLLWHDHLDEAHVIAQNREGADGAFIHGIMHRREPDFGNAAYWFRRVGHHPAYSQIARQAIPFLTAASEEQLAARLFRGSDWDPFAFIDACERASSEPRKDERVLRELQKMEFNALLETLQTA